ncbi:MAG: sigma-70 family RNA polymerase sigma factor [Gloeomargarita sp. SKYG116]|nr:sigma-70 family RNA polymerase sigma factor [Gloeomargarita sp. SKYG116]MDW8401637.1 sigma-70 family RNA polymerase sigma factor [Gloeomargarita sp. SKYGB_i_bin116]
MPSVPVGKLSTEELVCRCQQGFQPDRAAFTELVRRHQTHVERILYHLAADWHDRADLVQEVWVRAYRHIKRLQDPKKFRSWLSRIATNLFYDELRRRKRQQLTVSLDAPRQMGHTEMDWDIACDGPGPHDDLATQEFYERLQRAIAELPEVFRTTIILRELDGLAYEEIAEITGASLGTVKSRIARARARLQMQLKPYLEN